VGIWNYIACSLQPHTKSKYYGASKAGGEHSHVRKITAGGERKGEREWSGRLAKRRLKAGGCARMQLHWLRYCCTHRWLAACVVSMLLLH